MAANIVVRFQKKSQFFMIICMATLIGNIMAKDTIPVSNIESTYITPETTGTVASNPIPQVQNTPSKTLDGLAGNKVPAQVSPVVFAGNKVPAQVSPVGSGQLTAQQPQQNGLTGTTTEHKSPDGSVITVTKFNGQLPPNAFPQFSQSFHPWNNFNPYFGAPLYPPGAAGYHPQ